MIREKSIKIVDRLLVVIGVAAVIYHLTMVQWQLQGSTDHYITHAFLVMLIAALAALSDGWKAWGHWRGRVKSVLAIICIVTTFVTLGYFRQNAIEIEMSQPYITDAAIWVTGVMVGTVVILSWIHWGWIISSLTLLSIAYFLWGHLIPGPMGHPELSYQEMFSYMGGSLTTGMFGHVVQVSANVIFLFVIFGSLFRYTGVLPLFLEIGKYVGNVFRGGAAFPAVIGSGFMGTVTGAAVANVILTGSATIPMMKKTGFRKEHAAAIEAVASTGGQIVPPIMGSAAFLMAAFLEVPYPVIMLKAVIPAFLYYVGAGVGVFFLVRAAQLNPPKMEVDIRLILTTAPVFVIPMTLVIWMLLQYYSAGLAAFYGIILMVALALIRKEGRPKLSDWIEGFADAAKMASLLAIIILLVGILMQTALTTNIATKLSQTIIGLVGMNLLPILIISAVIAIIVGMELPTPAAYVIMFVTVVPLMIDVGVDIYAANFFAFYFAILSTLTPPVALSVLAASRLAGCGFLEACKHSLRLSIVGYLLPFAMAFTPAILGFPDKVGTTGWMVVSVLILATIAGGAALYGYFLRVLSVVDRCIMGAAALFGLGFVFNHNEVTLLIFCVLLLIGGIKPFIANLRERR